MPPASPPPSFAGRVGGALFLLLVLAAAVGGYVVLARESWLAGSLPLPESMRTTSEAHEELIQLGRTLNDVGADADGHLVKPTSQNQAAAQGLANRLDKWEQSGTALQPRLTPEEAHALETMQQGARMLRRFVASSTGKGGFDLDLLKAARTQIQHGRDLAQGKAITDFVTRPAKRALTGGPSAPPESFNRDVIPRE